RIRKWQQPAWDEYLQMTGKAGQIGCCLGDLMLAEHSDAMLLQQGCGHSLAGQAGSGKAAVIDQAAATGGASVGENRNPDLLGLAKCQGLAGPGLELG